MNRREVIAGAGGVLAAGVAAGLMFKADGVAFAADGGALTGDISKCIEDGVICQAHCVDELAKGNKEMGKCNRKVHEMLAVCEAMLSLTALKSERAKDLAAVCTKVCQDCADACAEHKAHWGHKMHMECKACHDSCLALIKAIKKVYG
jgi:Cys-rich four helix bundle protein (predicted Tat secretion target)